MCVKGNTLIPFLKGFAASFFLWPFEMGLFYYDVENTFFLQLVLWLVIYFAVKLEL